MIVTSSLSITVFWFIIIKNMLNVVTQKFLEMFDGVTESFADKTDIEKLDTSCCNFSKNLM